MQNIISLRQCEREGGAESFHLSEIVRANNEAKARTLSLALGKPKSGAIPKIAVRGFGLIWW